MNWKDELTECTVSNLFFISGKTLHTPALDCGILDGITRTIVMTLAQEEGVPVREGHYHLADLQRAEECFLTNTSMEIMPVNRVDSFAIGDGRPGSLTRRLQTRFADSRTRFLEPTS